MPDPQPSAPPDGPLESFINQVKELLEHLYDFPFLQRHSLATLGAGSDQAADLRRRVLEAIEALNPGPGLSFRAPPARAYSLLNLRYVEAMTVQEVARELGISQRQAYRDLRHAEESVAAVLWAQARPAAAPEAAPEAVSTTAVVDEIARLGGPLLPIDVAPLLRRALASIEPLAQQRGLTVSVTVPDAPVVATAEPMVAQQVFVNLLSFALRQAGAPGLTVELATREAEAELRVSGGPGGRADATALNPVTLQLAGWMGWRVQVATAITDPTDPPDPALIVHLPSLGPTLLIIDDNAGLVDLLQRYLADQPYRVLAASSGPEGLRLAREAAPSIIVLDVMMPGMDGWEALQRLRTHPDTAHTPVVICSAVGEAELAQSLGATTFLQKPVGRDDFLTALRQASTSSGM